MKHYNSTSVRAIIRSEDKILCEYLGLKDIFFLPGGRIEPGEELRETLTRELKEEISGMTFEIGKYRGKIGHIWTADGRQDSCLHHFFDARILHGFSACANENGREIRWFSLTKGDQNKLKPPALFRFICDPNQSGEWDVVDQD